MAEHNYIIEKLDEQSKMIEAHGRLIETQGERLLGIETALTTIAVQEEKILTVQRQVDSLWKRYDYAFRPDGTIAKLQVIAASCPVAEYKNAINRLWAAIGLIVVLIGSIKLWG